jgi:hypothetical protein
MRWYFYAVWQSCVILFLTFYSFGESNNFSNDLNFLNLDPNIESYMMDSLEMSGVFIIQAMCILANIKIFLSTHTHTWFSLLWQFGSIMWFYVLFFAQSNYIEFGSELFGMMPKLLGFYLNYCLLLLIVGGFILVDMGMNIVDSLIMEKIEEED